MARGRFISKEITIDKKVNKLSSPWSMLGFTWLLTHADVKGRVYGDPAVVRSIIFPRLPEITIEEVEGYIREWADTGLINWYLVDDDMYIEFPNFSKHQLGLRYDKEAKSSIPRNPDTPEQEPELPGNTPEKDGGIPEKDGKSPGKVEENLSRSKEEGQEKGQVEVEGSGNNDFSLSASFVQISGLKTPTSEKELDEWSDTLMRMKKEGVTPSVMRRACSELTEKKYRITSPKSIEKACNMILAEKKRRDNSGYIPISSNSEYSEAVNR